MKSKKNELYNSIIEFFHYIYNNDIELINEASLQMELGIFLRNKFPEYKIQLEKNVGTIISNGQLLDKKKIKHKKEMDIFIEDKESNKYVIELKFPPGKSRKADEIKKDIDFLYQLIEKADFAEGFFILISWHDKYFKPNLLKKLGFSDFTKNSIKIQDIIWKNKINKNREFKYLVLETKSKNNNKL